MEITVSFDPKYYDGQDLILLSAFQKKTKVKGEEKVSLDTGHWDDSLQESFEKVLSSKKYKGERNESFLFHLPTGQTVLSWGLGEKLILDDEALRKVFANIFKFLKANLYEKICVNLDHFNIVKNVADTAKLSVECLNLSLYTFDKFQSEKSKTNLKKVTFFSEEKGQKSKIESALHKASIISEGVNKVRDLVNEPPNFLYSEQLAKEIEKDVKVNLPQVKVKILSKSQIQKENMNLLLAVNKGSAYEPRVVHLTYQPKKMTSKTKHVALVGKGLTFDSGGYSIKPGSSMMGMKFDMAGAATVYGAFRNAVQLGADCMISCFLGITDNMISSHAITPDTIIKGRSGVTVEILNTDAEGRLVLADVLDYACDSRPDLIIDAATLTGACVRALGGVCGIMGNKKTLIEQFIETAETQGEWTWYLPIYEEYREDMKSKVADLKNIGQSGNAGAQKAAVFLEKFIRPNISWMHLDIAGVASDMAQLPYCPQTGGSGLMVRSLTQFLMSYNKL